ncbi:VWA1 protein, partial [Rhodinocichla rosea]|nr:VWA1 protein [Rhodinocichla rosea]
NRFFSTDVTSSSFRLVFFLLLSQDSGFYSLDFFPGGDPAARRALQFFWAQSSLVLSQLALFFTYEVALIPESNVFFFPPQRTRVTTLPFFLGLGQGPLQVLISDSGPHSFQVSWAPVLDSVAAYLFFYGPLPGNSARLLQVDGRHNSTLVEHLAPNTTYLVTVTAIYRSGKEKSLSAKACTLFFERGE